MQQTKKFLLLAGLLLGNVLISQAQTSDEVEVNKNEVGFGTQILFYNSSPVDFMYRRKGGKGYTRLGISFSRNTSSDSYSNGERSDKSFSATALLGREWRKKLDKHWLLNYGTDARLGYYKQELDHYSFGDYYSGGELVQGENIRWNDREGFSLALRPFFGIMYMINSRLILGTEASIEGGIVRKLTSNEDNYFVDGVKDIERSRESESQDWDKSINTIQAGTIFIYYRF